MRTLRMPLGAVMERLPAGVRPFRLDRLRAL
jgi:hypothetical protein